MKTRRRSEVSDSIVTKDSKYKNMRKRRSWSWKLSNSSKDSSDAQEKLCSIDEGNDCESFKNDLRLCVFDDKLQKLVYKDDLQLDLSQDVNRLLTFKKSTEGMKKFFAERRCSVDEVSNENCATRSKFAKNGAQVVDSSNDSVEVDKLKDLRNRFKLNKFMSKDLSKNRYSADDKLLRSFDANLDDVLKDGSKGRPHSIHISVERKEN